jgi:hypothetical protein
MFITEYQLKGAAIFYLALLFACVLIVIYSRRYSFQEKILRLIIAILLPILGIGLVLIESTISFIKKIRNKSQLIQEQI